MGGTEKQPSTMLNDRTVTEEGTWPTCFSTGDGAGTWGSHHVGGPM